jgi:hypothetical protein
LPGARRGERLAGAERRAIIEVREVAVPYYEFFWTPELVEHLAQHDVSREDFENAVCEPMTLEHSHSSGFPACRGFALDGRLLFCVYEQLDDLTLLPVTAYEVRDD